MAGRGQVRATASQTYAGAPPGPAPAGDLFTSYGFALGFVLVFLGGLALNLTPCVYPLIGVTLAYFGNQGGGGTRRILILALLYVAGIALMFSAIGTAAALSGGLFGAMLENPYVLIAIAAVMLVLAASSFGWFTLAGAAVDVATGGDGAAGLHGRVRDGSGDGRRRSTLYRTVRARPAADHRAQPQRVAGLYGIFRPGAGNGPAVYHSGARRRQHPQSAAIRRMAGLDRASVWLRSDRIGALLSRSAASWPPGHAAAALLRCRRRYLSGFHFTSRTPAARFCAVQVRGRRGFARRAGVFRNPARRAAGAGLSALRSATAHGGGGRAQAGVDRFRRGLVYPMPRDGAHHFRGSLSCRRSAPVRGAARGPNSSRPWQR